MARYLGFKGLTQSKKVNIKDDEIIIDLGNLTLTENGLVWKSNKKALSEEFTNAVLAALGVNSLKDLTADFEFTGQISITAQNAPEKAINDYVSKQIGSYFEYQYFVELLSQAANSGKFKSVSQDAKESFLAQRLMGQDLTAEDCQKIEAAAKNAAKRTLNDIIQSITNLTEVSIVIEAVAGSDPAGDIKIALKDAAGNNLEAFPPIMIELKYYSNTTITFFTLVDSNFGYMFSQFLYDTPQLWNHTKRTDSWKRAAITSYKTYLPQIQGKGTAAKSRELFVYLLRKGKAETDLKRKGLIVASRSSGNIVGFDLSLDSLINRQENWSTEIKGNRASFKAQFAGGAARTMGALTLLDKVLNKESRESLNQTPGEGPDWKTHFHFTLNKAFYGL